MTATVELRDLAGLFGWEQHCDDFRHADTFILGQHMITVDYHRDGAVGEGRRYEIGALKNGPKLRERTGGRNKKNDVKDWLVRLGH